MHFGSIPPRFFAIIEPRAALVRLRLPQGTSELYREAPALLPSLSV
jgi:hypothetical protein